VGSEPGSSRFHLFSHFSPLYCWATAAPQNSPNLITLRWTDLEPLVMHFLVFRGLRAPFCCFCPFSRVKRRPKSWPLLRPAQKVVPIFCVGRVKRDFLPKICPVWLKTRQCEFWHWKWQFFWSEHFYVVFSRLRGCPILDPFKRLSFHIGM
jgi:hypothetical protein